MVCVPALPDALEVLEGIEAVGVQRFSQRDVIRHPLVTRIVDAYTAREKAQAAKASATKAQPATNPRGKDRKS